MANQADTFVNIAINEVGYLEKKSNSQLYSKTANAGTNNYTKYGAWYDNGSLQAQPWCDMFVSWCGAQAGLASIIGHFAYCPSHVNWFKKRGQWYARGTKTPHKGHIIFFQQGGTACHVGIVEYVSGNYVHTIEGNTSGGSTLIANGGGVCRKSYPLTSSYILGYGAPAFTGTSTSTSGSGGSGGSSSYGSATAYASYYTWKNGSTSEPVYYDTRKSKKIGSLNAYESCVSYGKMNGKYSVVYYIDGTSHCKAGMVDYAGGVTGTQSGGKTWRNGSTSEPVYIDTRKSEKIGSLNARETCTCLAKVNGMYLVIYKIDGTNHYKIGFVEYSGGL